MDKSKFKKGLYTLSVSTAFIASLVSGSPTYGFDIPTVPERYAKTPYAALLYNEEPEICGAEKFSDTSEGEWYYGYVDRLVSDGIINGVTSTEFMPEGTLKVSECAALVVRILGLDELCAKYEEEYEYEGELAALWFRGYVGILLDTGVIEDGEYGLSKGLDGVFRMESRPVLEAPITRSQFAKLLARMTVLDDNYSCIDARCDYPERSIYGHEFIRGGMYEDDALVRYAGDIADFSEIPEEYVPYVLMGYYNGLFNGDNEGNFNPADNLLRSEMAKLMAVTAYPELRHGKDYRSNATAIPEGGVFEDYYGRCVLYKTAGKEMLRSAANGISVSEDGGRVDVVLTSSVPLGYTVEAHGYILDGTRYEEKAYIGLGSEKSAHGGKMSFDTAGRTAKVMYVLRDMARGGEAVGALDADIIGGKVICGGLIIGEESEPSEASDESKESEMSGESEGLEEPEELEKSDDDSSEEKE